MSCLDDSQTSRSVNQISMAAAQFVVVASRHRHSYRCRTCATFRVSVVVCGPGKCHEILVLTFERSQGRPEVCTRELARRCLHGGPCTEMSARRSLHGEACTEGPARRGQHGVACTEVLHGGACTGVPARSGCTAVPARRGLHGGACTEDPEWRALHGGPARRALHGRACTEGPARLACMTRTNREV